MAVTTFSFAGRIRGRLKPLDCAETVFAVSNGIVGRTRFFEAMRGLPGKEFSESDAQKLFDVLDQMEILQREVGVPIAWERLDAERIKEVLLIRSFARMAREQGDHRLDEVEARATQEARATTETRTASALEGIE